MKDLKTVFESRRSVNFFNPKKELKERTLREIVELAILAPSSFNLQPWNIIMIQSDEAKERLYQEACHQDKILSAPVILAIIGDTMGFTRENPMWDEKVKEGMTEEEAEKIIKYSKDKLYPTSEKKVAFAARNSSLLAMSLMYAAKYYGVDSHPMIGFKEDKVKAIFDIGDEKIVTMLMALGYFHEKHTLKPRNKRRGYDEIVQSY